MLHDQANQRRMSADREGLHMISFLQRVKRLQVLESATFVQITSRLLVELSTSDVTATLLPHARFRVGPGKLVRGTHKTSSGPEERVLCRASHTYGGARRQRRRRNGGGYMVLTRSGGRFCAFPSAICTNESLWGDYQYQATDFPCNIGNLRYSVAGGITYRNGEMGQN